MTTRIERFKAALDASPALEAKNICARADLHYSTVFRALRTGSIRNGTIEKLESSLLSEVQDQKTALDNAVTIINGAYNDEPSSEN